MKQISIKASIAGLMVCLSTCQLLGGQIAIVPSQTDFYFPETGIQVKERAVLLAIDNVSLPLNDNLCYYISKPAIRKEPVLTPSRDDPNSPDCVAAHFYGTVLPEDGIFRMWYYAVSYGETAKDYVQGPVCYAESSDGLVWNKPNLNQLEYKGSKQNNAINLPEKTIEGVSVIKDIDDPDPNRRYKMVYNPSHNGTFTIRTATSPNGIDWKVAESYPKDEFFEQASFFKHNDLFIIHGQSLEVGEGGGARGRQGYAWVSHDFNNWLKAKGEAFALPEPADPKKRGLLKPYDQVHLGVGGASLGNVSVGLYGIWHNASGNEGRNIPDAWFGHEIISCDLGLVVSNDGIHYREPVKGHTFISRGESPVTEVDGKSYPTILIQSNGIMNVGEETRIYHGRWRNAEMGSGYWGEIALATLPRDRWGALGIYPEHTEGEVWTTPILLPSEGCQIFLNADAADMMRVEIAGPTFELLPEFSGDNSGLTKEPGGLDCPIEWPKGDLKSLAGKEVRLRVHLKNGNNSQPRLYAIYLKSDEGLEEKSVVLESAIQ